MQRLAPALIVALTALAAGCNGYRENAQLRTQLNDARRQNQELQAQLAEAGQQIQTAQSQVAQLQELGGPARVSKLYAVARIRLGRYTGGYNANDVPGDEGVRVYLEPVDEQGSVLKAPGEVTVEAFDLSGPQPLTVARCHWSVDEVATHWAGGFLTSHYSFDCPWAQGTVPAHADLTIRVAFVDYLTGKTHSDQKAVTVTVPATATTSATATSASATSAAAP